MRGSGGYPPRLRLRRPGEKAPDAPWFSDGGKTAGGGDRRCGRRDTSPGRAGDSWISGAGARAGRTRPQTTRAQEPSDRR
nr:MAG TPA: hypothetical protein [Caudoviricetes sp.]